MHYLVYNKIAGRGRMPDALEQTLAFFDAHDMPLTVLPAAVGGSLHALLRELPADAPLLSLGGDGTLNGLLDAAVGSQRTVGILPAGSADDFATALGLSRDSLEPALQAIRTGHTRIVDTVRATLTFADAATKEVRFVNALGTGFDAEVASMRENRFDRTKGAAGYYVALGLGWLRMRRESLQVSVEGTQFFSGRSLLVSCQNSARTGGSFHFAPGASIDDGRFDLVVAGNVSRARILKLLPRVLAPGPWDDELVHRVGGTDFSFSWDVPRIVHMDGEIQLPAKRVDISVVPRSLQVYAPSGQPD